MSMQQTIPDSALSADNRTRHESGNGLFAVSEKPKEYLTTEEAAAYLRKSVSWLVRRNDIEYVRGIPNIYKREDLDAWFERNKFRPSIA